MLTKRDQTLINQILEKRTGIFGKELAKICNITDRTVRSDINRINKELFNSSICISSSKKDGYYLKDNDYHALLIYMDRHFGSQSTHFQNNQYIPVNSEERIIYLTLQLSFNSSYTTYDTLSLATYSSKTTIKNDLKKIEEAVNKIDFLNLEINQTKGTKLQGLESKKRILISKMIYHNIDSDYSYIKSALSVFLTNTDKLFQLYDLYVTFFESHNLIFTDRAIRAFTFETLIFCERHKNGMKLENTYSYSGDTTLELPFEKIENMLTVKLDEKERMYLYDALSFKQMLYNGANYFEDKNAIIVVDEFFKSIEKYYHINITGSPQTKENFILHISSLIQRIKHQIANNQYFIKDIKSAYPYSFELSTSIIPIIQKHYNITIDESELSYIAIHLSLFLNETIQKVKTIIVCANGLSESKLIEFKINNRFKDRIEIVDSCPLYQLEKNTKKNKDIKLVITTIPFVSPFSDNVTILQINPNLTDNDIYNCEKALLKIQYGSNEYTTLYDGFNHHFFNIYENKDPNEALDEMIEMLYLQNIITDKKAFLDSIKKRESYFSTVYNNIWIPHPLVTMATKTIFSVALIKESESINLIILCAIKEGETIKYRDIFNHITNLLTNIDLCNQITKINNFPNFIEFFKNIS
ncbi:MAG: PRD domain-containing protein [Erysipelotrichia bacterium]|nr:PRD domain-containing protein [Erysipelotrichia bacterium]